MNKHKKLAPNQGYVPRMTKAPITMAQILEKLKMKHASVHHRNEILSTQRRVNYVNEYDRLAGLLSHNITRGHVDYNRLKNRQAELRRLYEQSFEDSPYGKHPITMK